MFHKATESNTILHFHCLYMQNKAPVFHNISLFRTAKFSLMYVISVLCFFSIKDLQIVFNQKNFRSSGIEIYVPKALDKPMFLLSI